METAIKLERISVIIPVYNSENTIEAALYSVFDQSYQDVQYEVIIINDGSLDNSERIVEAFIDKNYRTNYSFYLINQPNGGVSKARNLGLKKSQGNYIAFLDSDDCWCKDKIKEQITYFDENVDFVCALRNSDTIGFPYKVNKEFAKITLRKLLIKVVGQTSTAIFKRKVLDNTGYFDEHQRYSEDANYWMRISLNNNMIILNKSLVVTENDYGKKGLSSEIKKMEDGVQKNINEMYYMKKINICEYIFF